MNMISVAFAGHQFKTMPSGALWWPAQATLIVSDLHFGKAARNARWGGAQLPPYDTIETLTRLQSDLAAVAVERVICLGDSFDAPSVEHHLPAQDLAQLAQLQTGRHWIWITGNHDPAPVGVHGETHSSLELDGITFTHIATHRCAEVSGHYHPKVRLNLRGRSLSRPAFLMDAERLILPAYGAYTGGLWSDSQTLSDLMAEGAQAILTGTPACRIAMPRRTQVPV